MALTDPALDLDGCDIDFTVEPTPDEEVDLFVLFAEALDPASSVTVQEVEATWGVS